MMKIIHKLTSVNYGLNFSIVLLYIEPTQKSHENRNRWHSQSECFLPRMGECIEFEKSTRDTRKLSGNHIFTIMHGSTIYICGESGEVKFKK